MAEFAGVDVLELILVQLDASDLIRFKRVSKSWQSLISNPRFIKSHLEYTHKSLDRSIGHRRIHAPTLIVKAPWLCCKALYNIVGFYNGLVCVSSRDVEFVVTNPLTRQNRKLKALPYRPHMHAILCWGFGYDSGTDDYKVIAGFRKSHATNRTSFYVLTLKSNTWKFIRQVNYSSVQNKRGISCDGGVQGKSGVLYGVALYWYLKDENNKLVVLSFHLTIGEFKENPTPDSLIYDGYHLKLGVTEEEYLCMYSSVYVSTKKWVMKNNEWELLTNVNDRWHDKFVVAHRLITTSNNVFALDDGAHVPANGVYMSASIFVKSLVSPHPHINNSIYDGPTRIAKKEVAQEDNESVERGAEGNIRKRKWNMRK